MSLTDDTVTPPQAGTWADLTEIAAQAMDVLRLEDADVDAPRVTAAAPVAVALIDQFLDADPGYTAATAPPVFTSCAVTLTVEVYRRKDAPFGVLNAWAPDDVALRIGPRAIASVRPQLVPWRRRWGIA